VLFTLPEAVTRICCEFWQLCELLFPSLRRRFVRVARGRAHGGCLWKLNCANKQGLRVGSQHGAAPGALT